MANEASRLLTWETLLVLSILHLHFVCYLRFQKAPSFGPLEACHHTTQHASISCAQSSFMVVPSGKGSSTICSILLVLCMENGSLTAYVWSGLVGSTLGQIIIEVPHLLDLKKNTNALACLGGMLLALSLVMFRALDFPAELLPVGFGVVGSGLCSSAMPLDPFSWTSVAAISTMPHLQDYTISLPCLGRTAAKPLTVAFLFGGVKNVECSPVMPLDPWTCTFHNALDFLAKLLPVALLTQKCQISVLLKTF